MSDIDDLIRQAARELQIKTSHQEDKDAMAPRVVNVTRKDGSIGQVQISAKSAYKEIVAILGAHSTSQDTAETHTADRIAALEAELKQLKGE
jgi:hypothetical protein